MVIAALKLGVQDIDINSGKEGAAKGFLILSTGYKLAWGGNSYIQSI